MNTVPIALPITSASNAQPKERPANTPSIPTVVHTIDRLVPNHTVKSRRGWP
ncbi:hypothetical protein QGN17_13345 [Sphingomonas sp. MAHUQ-71]|uniref:Uncharacterized protein n=1 Tax=Sphingomonas oryzagri TaxID=3042314 RepID=A0ABT6N3H1_9SPHN|nr:hypothetical protein [Sphingomonas oryzagri]MDH7639717.1 hypothetical protein [Sphingomonas oryzagri]